MDDAALATVMAGLAAGVLTGLLLAVPAALGRPRSPWPAAAVLVMGLLGAAALILHSASPDDYYGGGVTVWEHAGRNGAQPLVVAAVAVPVLAAGTLPLLRRPAWRAPALLLGALGCAGVLVAIVGASTGH